jgi:molecular chaperone Hsp33
MLGAALKEGAKFILQTKSDGPLRLLVVNYEQPGRMRGYAGFDAARIGEIGAGGTEALLGSGLLGMTIDPGGALDRYQGIVPLEGGSLADAALTYFRQSEQLPTFIRLAVARHYSKGGEGRERGWQWRAGGLIIQHLSPEGGAASPDRDRLKGDGTGYEYDENFERTRILAATVEDHELLDPTLAPERLLYRLFHEEGVRAYGARRLIAHCGCSRQRLEQLLRQFPAEDIAAMAEADGTITATCEYCNSRYGFAPGELLPAGN